MHMLHVIIYFSKLGSNAIIAITKDDIFDNIGISKFVYIQVLLIFLILHCLKKIYI